MSDTTANWIGIVLLYLTMFGTFKIIGVINAPWWMVLAPIWVPGTIFLLVMILAVWMISNKGKGDWTNV